jgi:hypothetical protein
VQPARPFYNAFVRGLFLACICLLAWTSYAALRSGRPLGGSAVSILLPLALVLGVGGSVLGDRSPRLRWALLIAVGMLLILVFLLQSHMLSF